MIRIEFRAVAGGLLSFARELTTFTTVSSSSSFALTSALAFAFASTSCVSGGPASEAAGAGGTGATAGPGGADASGSPAGGPLTPGSAVAPSAAGPARAAERAGAPAFLATGVMDLGGTPASVYFARMGVAKARSSKPFSGTAPRGSRGREWCMSENFARGQSAVLKLASRRGGIVTPLSEELAREAEVLQAKVTVLRAECTVARTRLEDMEIVLHHVTAPLGAADAAREKGNTAPDKIRFRVFPAGRAGAGPAARTACLDKAFGFLARSGRTGSDLVGSYKSAFPSTWRDPDRGPGAYLACAGDDGGVEALTLAHEMVHEMQAGSCVFRPGAKRVCVTDVPTLPPFRPDADAAGFEQPLSRTLASAVAAHYADPGRSESDEARGVPRSPYLRLADELNAYVVQSRVRADAADRATARLADLPDHMHVFLYQLLEHHAGLAGSDPKAFAAAFGAGTANGALLATLVGEAGTVRARTLAKAKDPAWRASLEETGAAIAAELARLRKAGFVPAKAR